MYIGFAALLLYTFWRNTELHQRNTVIDSGEISCVSRFAQPNETAQDCPIAAFVRPGIESAADE